jgi:hypothetical protein
MRPQTFETSDHSSNNATALRTVKSSLLDKGYDHLSSTGPLDTSFLGADALQSEHERKVNVRTLWIINTSSWYLPQLAGMPDPATAMHDSRYTCFNDVSVFAQYATPLVSNFPSPWQVLRRTACLPGQCCPRHIRPRREDLAHPPEATKTWDESKDAYCCLSSSGFIRCRCRLPGFEEV